MILYDYYSNSIQTEPSKIQASADMVQSFATIHDYLASCGCKPKLQRLDNEASQAQKEFIWWEKIDLQQTPAGSHRRNSSEISIRTYQNHLITCFYGTKPEFPITSWDLLLQQKFHHAQIIAQFAIEPQALWIRTTRGCLWLQPHIAWSTWVPSISAWATILQKDMGTTCHWWILHWSSTQ